MPPTAVIDTLAILWPAIAKSKISAAIAGGLALSFWGSVRSTQDIDISLLQSDLDQIPPLLSRLGFQQQSLPGKRLGLFELTQWEYQPPDFFVTVEIDLLVGDSEYYKNVLKNATDATVEGVDAPVRVISREDLIIHKLFADRLIDQADVQELFALHNTEIDREYLYRWGQTLGIRAELDAAIARFESQ
ncbi:hypothetical protein CKO51_12205 [Rhodopirellula sp. SM50]|nr:hypothetical protein [Rhodopirellula sp. SM50]PAY19125.1 hypothetical protein CKO51_12205 [Rhodopirellula sp. SM50]